jgi:hypothetical protein
MVPEWTLKNQFHCQLSGSDSVRHTARWEAVNASSIVGDLEHDF